MIAMLRSEFFRSFAKTGIVVLIVVLVVLVIVRMRGPSEQGQWDRRAQRHSCVNNLKQISLALRQWSLDNYDHFPFNLSTNAGGTMELADVGPDGFDRNAAFHFQVMSNELNSSLVLVCTKDKTRSRAVRFDELRPENITYRLRTGTSLIPSNPKEALIVCPIDGNTLYCDGTVEERKGGNSR